MPLGTSTASNPVIRDLTRLPVTVSARDGARTHLKKVQNFSLARGADDRKIYLRLDIGKDKRGQESLEIVSSF